MPSRAYYARKLFELSGLVPVGVFLLEHLYSNYQAVGPHGAERYDKLQLPEAKLIGERGVLALGARHPVS